MGKSLADGQGLRYGGVAGSPPATKFPPLYPLAIAALWKAAPDFPANAELFQAANVAFLVAAGVLFAWYVAGPLALGPGLAIGATSLAWLSSDLWRVTVIPLSEPLFLLTFLAAVAAGARMEADGDRGLGWAAAFVFLATLCFYTRTIGIVVWGAGLLTLGLRLDWKRLAFVAASGVASMAPWLVWSGKAAAAIPEPQRDILGSYGGWLTGQIVASPWSFVARVPAAASLLLTETVNRLIPGAEGPLALWAAVPVAVLVGAGAWRLLGRSRLLVLAATLYYVVLLVWPFYDRRLLAPLIPVLVLLAATGAVELGGRVPRALPRALVVAVVAVVGLWYAGASVEGLFSGRHDAAYRNRSEALVQALEAIRTVTPEDAVIGAPELWAAIHLYTGRASAPSARFLPMAAEGPSWGTPEEQYELWTVEGIDHVLVEHGGGVHGQALDRMDAACPGGAVELLASMRGAFLVRLNWDDTCRQRLLTRG